MPPQEKTLEIWMIQGEPGLISKEQVLRSLVLIIFYPNVVIWWWFQTLSLTTMLERIQDENFPWMNMISVQKNTTWELVSLPPRRKLVQCKWMFRTKVAADGSTWKYKAILVAKFFSHVQGVDYHETFAPVAKMDSIRLVLAISASKHWEVQHMVLNLSI